MCMYVYNGFMKSMFVKYFGAHRCWYNFSNLLQLPTEPAEKVSQGFIFIGLGDYTKILKLPFFQLMAELFYQHNLMCNLLKVNGSTISST